jgi:hypothetical protein
VQPRAQQYQFAVRLAWAASLLLASCDSTAAPPRGVAAERSAVKEHGEGVVVTGAGDPAIDVPAVQAAVDRGGRVVLRGHFSFNAPPTKPIDPRLVSSGVYPQAAEVLVSKAVTISGAGADEDERTIDEDGMTTIEAGTIPFYVEAPGEQVSIRGLRFAHPTADAILINAVRDTTIARCRIEGLVPFAGLGSGIAIDTTGTLPNPASPGHPETVSGTVSIVDNDIDAPGASARDLTLGITIFSVGVEDAEVEIHVLRNAIRNTTEPAINLRRIGGRARIDGNVIATGNVAGTAPRNQAIRVANIGSYVVAHNIIDCGWPSPDAEGIGVFSQFASWPIQGAIVVGNDVTMSARPGTVFNGFSAGIGVYGFAQNNVVLYNRIRGSARAALSIPSPFPLPPQAPAVPQDNAFIENSFVDFAPLLADIFVGEHALRTLIVGPGAVVDLGDQTTTRR